MKGSQVKLWIPLSLGFMAPPPRHFTRTLSYMEWMADLNPILVNDGKMQSPV